MDREYSAEEQVVRQAYSAVVDRYGAIAPRVSANLAKFLKVSPDELARLYANPQIYPLSLRLSLAVFTEAVGGVMDDAEVLEAARLLCRQTTRARSAFLADGIKLYSDLPDDIRLARASEYLHKMDEKTPPPVAPLVEEAELSHVEAQLLEHYAAAVKDLRRRFFGVD
jgi:hypothetical protein